MGGTAPQCSWVLCVLLACFKSFLYVCKRHYPSLSSVSWRVMHVQCCDVCEWDAVHPGGLSLSLSLWLWNLSQGSKFRGAGRVARTRDRWDSRPLCSYCTAPWPAHCRALQPSYGKEGNKGKGKFESKRGTPLYWKETPLLPRHTPLQENGTL